MISFSNINKQYGKQLLFVDASFQLNPGEKVGLVGPNGARRCATTVVPSEKTRDKKTSGISALVHATPGVTASRFAGRTECRDGMQGQGRNAGNAGTDGPVTIS